MKPAPPPTPRERDAPEARPATEPTDASAPPAPPAPPERTEPRRSRRRDATTARPDARSRSDADPLEIAPDEGPARCSTCGEVLVEEGRAFHCRACRERVRRDRRTGLPTSWTTEATKTSRSTTRELHTECPDCGYDLRGLRGDATCPECGLANAASIVLAGENEFEQLPPAFLRALTRRFLVVAVAVWCAPFAYAAGGGLALWLGPRAMAVGDIGAAVCLALSAWALSAPIARAEGERNGFGRRDRVRVGARWSIAALGLGAIESIGIWGVLIGGAIGAAFDVVLLAVTLLAMSVHAMLRGILLLRAAEWVGIGSGQFFAKMSFLTALLSGAFVVFASLIGLLIAPTGALLMLGLPMRGLSTLLFAIAAVIVFVGVIKARNDRRQSIDRRRERLEREAERG